MKGADGLMNSCNQSKFIQLEKKVEQHEQLITQLVEIIAATNKRLIHLSEDQPRTKRMYTHS